MIEPIKAPAAETTATEGRSPDEPLPALLTVSKAAARIGISRASAQWFAVASHLQTRRFGERRYVVTARLLAMLDDSIEAGAD